MIRIDPSLVSYETFFLVGSQLKDKLSPASLKRQVPLSKLFVRCQVEGVSSKEWKEWLRVQLQEC